MRSSKIQSELRSIADSSENWTAEEVVDPRITAELYQGDLGSERAIIDVTVGEVGYAIDVHHSEVDRGPNSSARDYPRKVDTLTGENLEEVPELVEQIVSELDLFVENSSETERLEEWIR